MFFGHVYPWRIGGGMLKKYFYKHWKKTDTLKTLWSGWFIPGFSLSGFCRTNFLVFLFCFLANTHVIIFENILFIEINEIIWKLYDCSISLHGMCRYFGEIISPDYCEGGYWRWGVGSPLMCVCGVKMFYMCVHLPHDCHLLTETTVCQSLSWNVPILLHPLQSHHHCLRVRSGALQITTVLIPIFKCHF